MSVGFGLIGMGRHGSRYARHLLDGVDGCRLAAFSRRQCAAGEAFARECGVPFLPKWQDVLRHHDVAAAIVVTPPGLNIDICVEAAKAGRAILVEKPLALTVSDARRIVNAAHDARVPIMTAQTLRFTPVLQRLKQALANAGPLHYLSLMMRVEPAAHPWLDDPIQSGGGVMLEIGVHLLDMIRFLTNEEPVQVSAELVRRRTVRVEDIAFANYALPSGLRCCVEVSRVSGGRMCRVEAIGTAGAWVADVTQSVLWRIVGRTADAERVPDRPTLVTVLEEFARSLQSGAAMPVTGEDGLRAVAMAEAAYRSAAEGRPVAIAN